MRRGTGVFGALINAERARRLRDAGALVLDVDDTLLARAPHGDRHETFAESRAAALLPELLLGGVSVGLVTGHGWQQLETRLLKALVESLLRASAPAQADAALSRLRVYANRGATRIEWDGAHFAEDEAYARPHRLRAIDEPSLRRLLATLAAEFDADWRTRAEWYKLQFPRFDFDSLPATVAEREGAVLVLRPVPSLVHRARSDAGTAEIDPRADVCRRGLAALAAAELAGEYELAQSGRSSIEITRRGVSKQAALRDLIERRAVESGATVEQVEASLVYVGDEFDGAGNDRVIREHFPRCLCISVAPEAAHAVSEGVISTARHAELSGPVATERVLAEVLSLLV